VLVAGTLILACMVSATRAVFALPHSLAANWIFRITTVQSPLAYFNAVRKSLSLLSAWPAWMVCSAIWLALWPGRVSVEASIVLLLVACVLIEYRLYQFRKIPFACSWLPEPGQSVNTVRAIAYGLVFLAFASILAGIELYALRRVARFIVLGACLALWLGWLRRRGREFASAPGNTVQFDDIPNQEIFALDLRADSAWSGEQVWVEPVDSGRSRVARLQTAGLIVLFLVILGFAYEKLGEWQDRKSFPRVGRAIDIGGRSLNIYCAGSGGPAVVLESGGGLPGYTWKLVEQRVSGFTRVCWYDRAGYGWSDPAPSSRTSADIAGDLHSLLHAAGVAPPYLLVGHSFGGYTIRVFASRYRPETAGLVLVDSASEHEDEIQAPPSMQGLAQRYLPKFLLPMQREVGWFFVHDGAQRLMDDGPGIPPRGSEITQRDMAIVHALQMQTKAFDASLEESGARRQSIRQVLSVHDLGNMPLIVLTAAKQPLPPSDPEEARLLAAFYKFHVYTDQPRMLGLSRRSRQIILQTGHGIPFEAPDAVTDAVREVLAAARSDAQQ
jgi:pimeloyl-ACP methyl ester carboxylesterase